MVTFKDMIEKMMRTKGRKYRKTSAQKPLRIHSISTKISVSMLIIASIMIVTFTVISITYSYKNMLNSSIRLSRQDLTSASANIDNLLETAENYSVLLATNSNIQHCLSKGANADSESLSLNEISVRNTLNETISLFVRVNAVLLSDTAGHIYDSGVSVMDADTLYQDMQSASGWKNTYPAPYRISVIGGNVQPNVFSFTRPIHDYRTGRLIGYVTIYIDETYMRDAYATESNTRNVHLTSLDGIILSSTDDTIYSEDPVHVGESPSGFLHTDSEYIIYDVYAPLQCYIVSHIQQGSIDTTIHNMITFLVLISLLLITATVILSRIITKKLTKNIMLLTESMKNVSGNRFDVEIPKCSNDEIGLLASSFSDMIKDIRETTDRLIQEQRAKREFQLELLTHEINPHFLYNTLDNISSLTALDKPEEVLSLVNNLADFYRGVLSRGNIRLSLEEELKIASSYLNIMRTRYYRTFQYDIDVPKELYSNTILRLTLQPILENAIYHGFEAHEPGGMIRIRAAADGETVLVTVTDNGKGIPSEKLDTLLTAEPSKQSREGFAVKNVNDRIQLYYGADYGLSISSIPEKGTTVTIKIPKKDREGSSC